MSEKNYDNHIVVSPIFGNVLNLINPLFVFSVITENKAKQIVLRRTKLYEDLKKYKIKKDMIKITKLIITIKTNQNIKWI